MAGHHHERGIEIRHNDRPFIQEEALNLLISGGPRFFIEGGTREIDQIIEPLILPMRFVPGRAGAIGQVEVNLRDNPVAPPGDAEINFEPFAHPIVVLFLQHNLDAYPGLFPLSGEGLGQVGHGAAVRHMQTHIQAIRIPGLGQQSGGGGRIARGRLGIGEEILREGGPDRRIFAQRAKAQLDALPDVAPIGRQFEGFANADIIPRRTVRSDPRHLMRVGGQVNCVKTSIAGEVEEAVVVEAQNAIGNAALHRGNRRLLVVKEEEFKRVDCWRAAPIILIRSHDRAVARDQLFHDERAAAVEDFAGILSARFENDDLVLRQTIEKIRVGRIKLEYDRMIAAGLD